MAGALYWEHIVGIGDAAPVTKQLQNVSCGIGRVGQHIPKEGARGTRSKHAGTVSDGPYAVGGPLAVQPAPDELAVLLPKILGGTPAGNNYPLAETLPEFVVTQDKKAKVLTWAGCKVNSARFSSSAASPQLVCELDIQGKTESVGNAGTFPAIGATLTVLQPFIMQQLVVTLDSITRQIDNWSLTVDNVLMLDRFLNSQTRTELPEQDRLVTVECDNPFTAADAALYNIAVAGFSGLFVFTNGARSLTFSTANLKAPPQVLEGAQRGEVMNRLRFTAYETGTPGTTTKELVTTLVQ
jgi:hypothetical protein